MDIMVTVQTLSHPKTALREEIVLSWSGGKDSAMALHELRRQDIVQVVELLTTVNRAYDRISMHGVRTALLDRQAEAVGLPVRKIWLSEKPTNQEYEAQMEAALNDYVSRGIGSVAFGDIFLEDLKQYREKNLARVAMRGLFPIWKKDTRALVEEFITLGFKAILVCVDTKVLDRSWAGRMIDGNFLNDLPSHIDPCGENGEFHSYVFDGPIFNHPVPFTVGDTVLRENFCFCDLMPI